MGRTRKGVSAKKSGGKPKRRRFIFSALAESRLITDLSCAISSCSRFSHEYKYHRFIKNYDLHSCNFSVNVMIPHKIFL